MGNEMGNRNVTALQEEDNKADEPPIKCLEEAVDPDDVNGNQVVSSEKEKDFLEKVPRIAAVSLGGDPQIDSQEPDGQEQDETDFQHPDGLLKAPVESNGTHGQASERPRVSLSKDLVAHEKEIESTMEGKQLATSDHQILGQFSSITEDKKTGNSTSSSIESTKYNAEPLESLNPVLEQHGMDEIHDFSSVIRDDESQGSDGFLGSSFQFEYEERDHFLDIKMSESEAASKTVVCETDHEPERKRDDLVMKDSMPRDEEMIEMDIHEEEFEPTEEMDVGNNLDVVIQTPSNFPSDAGNQCDEELTNGLNLNRNGSAISPSEIPSLNNLLNSNQKVSDAEYKCIIHAEIQVNENDSDNEVNEDVPITNNFCENFTKELESNEVKASQSGLVITATNQYDNSTESPINDCQLEEDKVAMEEPTEKVTSKSQTLSTLPSDELTDEMNINGNGSTISRSEVLPLNTLLNPNQKVSHTEDKCMIHAEIHVNGNGSDNEVNEHATIPTNYCEHSTAEVESNEVNATQSEFVIIAPNEDSIYTGISINNCQLKEANLTKEEPTVEKAKEFNGVADETIGRETEEQYESPANPIKGAQNMYSPQFYEQSTVQDKKEENAELKQNPSSEFFETKASNFTSPPTSTDDSMLQSSGPADETTGDYESNESEGPEDGGRPSTETNPNGQNIGAEMRKCASFNFNLRSGAEDSDQTPLLHQERILTTNNQDPLQNQSIPVEETATILERSKSNQAAFQGFLKEEEEARVEVSPHKEEDGAVSSNSSEKDLQNLQRRDKRKPRSSSSLFSNCICCATVNTL